MQGRKPAGRIPIARLCATLRKQGDGVAWAYFLRLRRAAISGRVSRSGGVRRMR